MDREDAHGRAAPDCMSVDAVCRQLGLNRAYLLRHRVAPLGVEQGRLVLAMADVDADEVAGAIGWAARMPVERRKIANPVIIAILSGESATARPARLDGRVARLLARTPGAEVARLVRRLVIDAVDRNASGISLTRDAESLHAVDAGGRERERLDPALADAVFARLAELAEVMDTRPAEGSFLLARGSRNIRVAVRIESDDVATLEFAAAA